MVLRKFPCVSLFVISHLPGAALSHPNLPRTGMLYWYTGMLSILVGFTLAFALRGSPRARVKSLRVIVRSSSCTGNSGTGLASRLGGR